MIQRITAPLLSVLEQLEAAEQPTWGLLLCKLTGLPSGTVYPLLARLEESGWVEGCWDESQEKGPRRRFYSLTDEGHRRTLEAQAAVANRARGRMVPRPLKVEP